ncbi:MAG: carboxypeptidase-like regulatory domain-containing protein [Bryobacteraceae bacterium]
MRPKTKVLGWTSAIVVLLLISIRPVDAQAVTGTVLGTVTDASGAVIANARVLLTNVGTGVVRTEQTNASGNYTFVDVPEGSYSISVEMANFKKETRENIGVSVNTSTRVDVQLQPGNITQQIEVTAAQPHSRRIARIRKPLSRAYLPQICRPGPIETSRAC